MKVPQGDDKENNASKNESKFVNEQNLILRDSHTSTGIQSKDQEDIKQSKNSEGESLVPDFPSI